MLTPKKILLASHGTEGARAAEQLAYRLCAPHTRLHHLVVVPDFWKGMMGDDWLNNASTREDYANYIEDQLEAEVRDLIRRLQRETKRRRIRYDFTMMQGKPTDCLTECATQVKADLVVVGAQRPKGREGLRSRIDWDRLLRRLGRPLVVAPFPGAS